ncbi:MAG: hypothetical protein IJ415_02895 [Clostridia bacterium]|nr:hypothetical protein [Clostridia bacterium]
MRKKTIEYCCLNCKYFAQFYVIEKQGEIYDVDFGYCYKYQTSISKQKQCASFEEGEQKFEHEATIDCFNESAKLKRKFKELKNFLNSQDFE